MVSRSMIISTSSISRFCDDCKVLFTSLVCNAVCRIEFKSSGISTFDETQDALWEDMWERVTREDMTGSIPVDKVVKNGLVNKVFSI